MKAIFPIFLTLALAVGSTAPAADFFGVPDKTIIPKPTAATPVPVTAPPPATPAPVIPPPATPVPEGAARPTGSGAPATIVGGPVNEGPATLLPDGTHLKTPTVGGQRGLGRPFRDLGPDNGILIGFEYTVGKTAEGAPVIDSLTPFYIRSAGKARGTLRGTPKPGNPATVLEARPGFAVASIEAKGSGHLEAFRLTFMRYESGALDPAERYVTKWIGAETGEVSKLLRTDTRPIIGIYGKADTCIHEFGLLVRREIPPPPKTPTIAIGNPFGTPIAPDTGESVTPAPEMTEPLVETTPAAPLEPTAFDPNILKTEALGKSNSKGTPFRDLAPIGSLLIGFDYAVTKTNGQKIGSLRPLYQLSNGGKKLGDLHGAGPTDTRVDARPGYAIGAIMARGDFMLRGFQLTFMRIKGPGLDPADSYQGEFIGGRVGATKILESAGQPIIGLYGKIDIHIDEIGFFVKKTGPGLTRPTLPSTVSPIAATPAPLAQSGVEVFACADDSFTLFLNGREILSGNNLRQVESGTFPIVKGDVLTAIVKDSSGGGGEAWLSLRVVRDGKTILDAGDMRYLLTESLNWKTNKLVTGFRDPKVWTHEKRMGEDARPRAAWAGTKDIGATTLYFKGIVP